MNKTKHICAHYDSIMITDWDVLYEAFCFCEAGERDVDWKMKSERKYE